MDEHDKWFTPENVEEQIEYHLYNPDQASTNTRVLHDLQSLAADDGRRLAAIRERLVQQASTNGKREPLPLYHDQNADVFPQKPAFHPARSAFLVRLFSGVAAVLVITSMLLAFTLFGSHHGQEYVNSKTPVASPPLIRAHKAVFLLDTTSGNVLVDVNSHAHLPVGNMALLMTAVVTIDNARLNQYVTIDQATLNEVSQGASATPLIGGDQMQLRELLYALLLPSSADAAFVIAHAVGGSTQNFVAMMNDEAHQLQLNDTHFSSPYTSSSPDAYSSAADLTHLLQYALQLSDFTQIISQSHYTLAATSRNHNYIWITTNTLYPGINVIKDGYTATTGACIVFTTQRNGHLLIGTELGASSRNVLTGDIKNLTQGHP